MAYNQVATVGPVINEHAPFVGRVFVEWARRLRDGSDRLLNTDQTFISNIAGGAYRHAHAALGRCIDLSARAITPSAAFSLGDSINVEVATRRAQGTLALSESIALETEAQASQDVLPMLALARHCPVTAAKALDACITYRRELDRQIEALAHVVKTGRVS